MRSILGLPVPTRIGNRDCTGFGDVVEVAVERGAFLVEERSHDLDGLLEPTHAHTGLLQLDAVGGVFVDLPPGTDAEHHPAVRDVVDRCRAIGEHRRVVHRGGRDEWSELDPIGDRGDRGQHRPALVDIAGLDGLAAGVGHVVVGVPDAVPSVGVGHPGEIEHLGGRSFGVGPDRELHDRRP
jgi:hypothetical protein